MEFGPGFWGPVVATAAMVLGVIVAWLILAGSRRTAPQKPTGEKLTTYACGEDVKVRRWRPSDIKIDETRPHGEWFFSPIAELFRGFYKYIRPSHSGDLSTYLLWIAFGIVIILIMVGMMMW